MSLDTPTTPPRRGRPALTEEQLRATVAACEQHPSRREAAAALGISLAAVNTRLDIARIRGMAPSAPPVPVVTPEQVVEMRRQSLNMSDAARKLGIGYHYARRLLEQSGFSAKDFSVYRQEPADSEIRKTALGLMIQLGVTMEDVGKHLGVTRQAISAILSPSSRYRGRKAVQRIIDAILLIAPAIAEQRRAENHAKRTQFIDALSQSRTIYEAARRLGIKSEVLTRNCAALDIDPKAHLIPVPIATDAHKINVKAYLRQQKVNGAQVAERLVCSPGTVYHLLDVKRSTPKERVEAIYRAAIEIVRERP